MTFVYIKSTFGFLVKPNTNGINQTHETVVEGKVLLRSIFTIT